MNKGRKQKRGRKMDRRGRRGRGHSSAIPTTYAPNYSESYGKSFLGCLSSFLILSSLVALIYMMLEYHCTACTAKCDLNNITKTIDDIAINLSIIKASYYDLENKISKFSQDLPKIEGQIEILEALANTMETKDFEFNLKHLSLPNVEFTFNDQPRQKKINNVDQTVSNEICNTSYLED